MSSCARGEECEMTNEITCSMKQPLLFQFDKYLNITLLSSENFNVASLHNTSVTYTMPSETDTNYFTFPTHQLNYLFPININPWMPGRDQT